MSKSFLISIGIFYFITTVFTSLIINQIFKRVIDNSPIKLYFFISLIFLFFILYFVLYKAYQIIMNYIKNDTYIKFRLKILSSFVILLVLTSLPQTIVSIVFINSAVNNIYSSYNQNALKYSQEIYINEHVRLENNLLSIMNYIFNENQNIENIENQAKQIWETISSINLSLTGMQVIWDDKSLNFGSGAIFNSLEDLSYIQNMQAVKLTKDNTSFIMVRREFLDFSVILFCKVNEYSEEYINHINESIGYFDYINELYNFKNRNYIYYFYMLFIIPIFFVSVYLSFIISDILLKPLFNISKALDKVKSGDYNYRLIMSQKSEFYFLANSFNSMTYEIENAREKLMNIKKLQMLKEISSRLAHEIKNPLTPIKLSTERLVEKYYSNVENFEKYLVKYTKIIINEVNYISSIVQDFSSFSKMPQAQMSRLELSKVIEDCCLLYEEYKNVNIVNNIPKDLFIMGDRLQLKQVFVNLFKNSIEAIGRKDEVIQIDCDLQKDRDNLTVRFYNSGSNIPKDYIVNIFNPYITTKENGTGLGLSICQKIISEHDGKIWAENTESGVLFFIELKLA